MKKKYEMIYGINILCIAVIMALVFAVSGCGKEEPDEPQDLEAVRAELREQVERGKLNREEAIVKLAEAEAEFAWGTKDEIKNSTELEELSKKLKDQLDKNEITEEEAEKIWLNATEEAKSKSGNK